MTNKEKRERGGKLHKKEGGDSSSGDEAATTVQKRVALPAKPAKQAPVATMTPPTRPTLSFVAEQQQVPHNLEAIVHQMAGNIQQLSVNYGKLYEEFKRQEL